eukprot:NODE_669_length_5359_cov_0.427376.p3 type:complete len:141 gc:universal NODE_669_length_5359_cov_0.427376:3979-4401(+)
MLALLCMLANVYYPKSNINFDHCVQIALVHDLAEAQTGDFTPSDNISDEEKYVLEAAAFKMLPNQFSTLWMEYVTQETAESHFVKDCDKFDMIYQAYLYEQRHSVNLQEFFDSAKFKTDIVKSWVSQLSNVRSEKLGPNK